MKKNIKIYLIFSNKYNWNYIFLIAGIFFAHVLLALLPAINLEFAFVDAARYFHTGDINLINQYFRLQANTIGLPILASFVATFFPKLDILIIIRLLSTSGIILLGIGIINFAKFLKRDDALNLLLLILLNPLVWVFSARATADFLPAALGIFAISIVLAKDTSNFTVICSGILLGLAAILKYHAIFLLFFLIPCLWNPTTKVFKFKYFSIIFLISLSLLSLFLFFVFKNFGFWVTPPAFQSIHGISLSGLVNNFFLYSGYLILICAPSSFVFYQWRDFFYKYMFRFISIFISIFLLGYLCFYDGGELNFGPLDRFINKNISAGLFSLLSLQILLPFFFDSKKHLFSDINKSLTIALLFVIGAFSLTRPSQRYLLVILPIFVCLISRKIISNKYIFYTSIMIFTLMDIFIAYSQWCTGTAAQKMVDAIRSAGLINITDAGAIEGHVGNQFNINNRYTAKYTVIAGNDDFAKIKVQSGLSMIDKKFSLIEIKNPVLIKN